MREPFPFPSRLSDHQSAFSHTRRPPRRRRRRRCVPPSPVGKSAYVKATPATRRSVARKRGDEEASFSVDDSSDRQTERQAGTPEPRQFHFSFLLAQPHSPSLRATDRQVHLRFPRTYVTRQTRSDAGAGVRTSLWEFYQVSAELPNFTPSSSSVDFQVGCFPYRVIHPVSNQFLLTLSYRVAIQ